MRIVFGLMAAICTGVGVCLVADTYLGFWFAAAVVFALATIDEIINR